MQNKSDLELLRTFAGKGEEAAFRELVGRYADLVYSAAMRQVASSATAADIAQSVFTDLARKAGSLAKSGGGLARAGSLAGWLHRATRYAALNHLRADRRRAFNERQAMEQLLANADPAADWEQIRPLLDEALDSLDDQDREALLLRFFKNQDFRAVGAVLGVSDDAAQKRVGRALERLRGFFAKRQVAVGAGALVALLTANAVQAAPAGLALAAGSAALAAGGAGTVVTSGLFQIITMTKLQTALIGIVLAGLVATPLVWQAQSKLRRENEALQAQLAQLKGDNDELAGQAAQLKTASVRPVAKTSAAPAGTNGVPLKSFQDVVNYIDTHDRQLSAAQIEAYLQRNHRNPESLLAAFQVSLDAAYLREAATNFPGYPAVQFAVIANHLFPDEQRKWIDAFKSSSPDNGLAWYFSALDYFNGKQPDQAAQELAQATRRQLFSDYGSQTVQAVEEMYDSAGWPDLAAMAVAPGTTEGATPYANLLKQLANDTLQSQQQELKQGNAELANTMAATSLTLGEELRQGSSPIAQLVGIGIENKLLSQLDPAANYDFLGQSVASLQAELAQQKITIKTALQNRDLVRPTLGQADLVGYWEREKMYGEMYAMQWLQSMYPQAGGN